MPSTLNTSIMKGINFLYLCKSVWSKSTLSTPQTGFEDSMVIESLNLYYHLPCFVCARCGISLGDGLSDVELCCLIVSFSS
ncbi:unnamed protein product [Trichobilharzia regenti]|nr:unnamed protein product [Trichobilharzia regenti]